MNVQKVRRSPKLAERPLLFNAPGHPSGRKRSLERLAKACAEAPPQRLTSYRLLESGSLSTTTSGVPTAPAVRLSGVTIAVAPGFKMARKSA